MTTWRVVTLSLAAALTLGGCETFQDIISSEDKEEIPGERISVMALERKLEADPRLASLEVVLPRPYVNEDWPQPGGYADNAMHHLQASGSLDVLWSSNAGSGSSSSTELATALVAAAGQVYVLDTETVVRAFNSTTGDEAWETELAPEEEDADEGRGGGVAFESGRLFVTTGFGEAIALDAASGEVAACSPSRRIIK